MTITYAQSGRSAAAREMVQSLQRRFADRLEAVSAGAGHPVLLERITWLRDEGRHGGGHRLFAGDTPVFNRATLNVSQVHYDDLPGKRLSSATALSCIVHPENPHGASMHMHISWTEMRDGAGYWRMMADLNPALPESADRAAFETALRDAAPGVYPHAQGQGERYFTIPALSRTRGVAHFYLERYATDDPEADAGLARKVAEGAMDAYADLLGRALAEHATPTDADRARQLEYHTVYLFQVLTLDRGTTSGLLVHDQNDVGILGSLPSHVDRARLESWRSAMPAPQDALLDGIVGCLSATSPSAVSEPVKKALAQTLREHYRRHPEALGLQAAGDVIPPTVANHQSVGSA